MRFRILGCVLTAVALFGCKIENDMMVPKDVAGFEAFEIEGQQSASINTAKLTVSVTMPAGTDLTALRVANVRYTAATKAQNTLITKGQMLDLSDTTKIRMYAFREFEWKMIAVNAKAPDPVTPDNPDQPSDPDKPKDGPQLYNMSLDNWTLVGKGWFPYAADADDTDKNIWATSNKGTSDLLGKNTTEPEENFLAVSGTGKKAVKLSSQWMLIKFAAGNLFTGEFCGLKGTKGADLAWGVPFTSRPKSLHGYYCYQPVKIDKTDENHADMKGQLDKGHIFVILADWDKKKGTWDGYPANAIDDKGRFHVINSENQFVDVDNDPAIIGYGRFEFNTWTDSYQEFDAKIDYRSDRTPSVIAIVAASSLYGDYFTGGVGTLLYLDELSLRY